jgi:hypothetical protein
MSEPVKPRPAHTPAPREKSHSPGPWRRSPDDRFAIECPTDIPDIYGTVATFGYLPNVDRTVACVNACEGIDDPAATLAEVRRVLLRTVEWVGWLDGEPSKVPAERAAELRAVLAKLGPKP